CYDRVRPTWETRSIAMALLPRPFGSYVRETCVGLWLLLALGVIRFLLKPVFGIPYQQATTYSSLTFLLILLTVVYAARAARRGETYRDLLGIAVALSFSAAAIIIVAIAIDDFGGIDTYYTDPAHGGNLNPFAHMGGHLVGAFVGSLLGWGIGSLAFAITRAGAGPGAAPAGGGPPQSAGQPPPRAGLPDPHLPPPRTPPP